MNDIKFRHPHEPQGREAQRNAAHRDMANQINTRFGSNESYIESLIASFQAYVTANNLPPWTPPPTPWGNTGSIGGET